MLQTNAWFFVCSFGYFVCVRKKILVSVGQRIYAHSKAHTIFIFLLGKNIDGANEWKYCKLSRVLHAVAAAYVGLIFNHIETIPSRKIMWSITFSFQWDECGMYRAKKHTRHHPSFLRQYLIMSRGGSCPCGGSSTARLSDGRNGTHHSILMMQKRRSEEKQIACERNPFERNVRHRSTEPYKQPVSDSMHTPLNMVCCWSALF